MTCSPGKYGFGRSRLLSLEETLERLPTIQTNGLRGGVIYYDGQFDDTRLLIHLAATAADHGAVLLNYAPVVEITRGADGFADGVIAVDSESGQTMKIPAHVVVNAAGIFADDVRRLAEPEVKDDRAQPGHPPGLRARVSARQYRDHGAPYQRRPGAVCHSLA